MNNIIDEMYSLIEVSRLEIRRVEKEMKSAQSRADRIVKKSMSEFKKYWPEFKKNLFIKIAREQRFRDDRLKYNKISLGDIQATAITVTYKNDFVYKKGNSNKRLSFCSTYLKYTSTENIMESVEDYAKAYKFLRDYVSKKTTPLRLEYTMEEYFRIAKFYKMIDCIDDFEVWKNIQGNHSYSEEKFLEELNAQKREETLKQAVRVLKR